MSESRESRVKRLRMRAMRRGIREMDLILSEYAARHLGAMDEAGLNGFDALLEENDQDLYAWVTGRVPAPAAHADLINNISQVFQKK